MKFLELKIKGMTCDQCAQTITKKFDGKRGITEKILVILKEKVNSDTTLKR